MKRVLVLHALSRYHRSTTIEFVTSFGRYAPEGTCVEYHNIRNLFLPQQLKSGYDALILPYDILSLRSSAQKIQEMIKKLERDYAVRDKQDVLAMCSLQYAAQLSHNLQSNNSESDLSQKVQELSELIDLHLSNY